MFPPDHPPFSPITTLVFLFPPVQCSLCDTVHSTFACLQLAEAMQQGAQTSPWAAYRVPFCSRCPTKKPPTRFPLSAMPLIRGAGEAWQSPRAWQSFKCHEPTPLSPPPLCVAHIEGSAPPPRVQRASEGSVKSMQFANLRSVLWDVSCWLQSIQLLCSCRATLSWLRPFSKFIFLSEMLKFCNAV